MLLTSYQKNICQTHAFPASSLRFVNQSKTNDEEPLILLYRDHASELLLIISKIIPQHETAEDVLHDTFMKIKSNIHAYDSSRSNLLTWSKAIARNVAVDYVRLKSSRNSKLNQSIEYSKHELGLRHTCNFNPDRIGIRQLINVLNPEQLAIIELFYYKGFTHEEVSEALNIPLGTIKTRIRTSIQKLRKYFN